MIGDGANDYSAIKDSDLGDFYFTHRNKLL